MRRNIKIITLFNFFTDLRFYSAILVIYFAKVTGSYTLAMSLFSIVMISSALFEIPTGIFSDFLGRKKTIVIGAICSVMATTLYAFGHTYMVLVFGAIFEGLQRSFYSGNNDALLYESLDNDNSSDIFENILGRTGSMFQIAAVVAAIVGSIMVTKSMSLVLWASVVSQIACVILALFVTEPKKKSRVNTNIYIHLIESVKLIIHNPKLRLLSLKSIVGHAVGESTYQFTSVFVNTLWPIWAVGIARMLANLGAAISYWISGRVVKRFGSIRILLAGSIYGVVIDIAAVVVNSIFSPIMLASTSLFFGMTNVSTAGLMHKEFTDEQRSTTGSVSAFFGSIALGIFSIVLGMVADKWGAKSALMFAYICSIPTIYWSWKLVSKFRD